MSESLWMNLYERFLEYLDQYIWSGHSAIKLYWWQNQPLVWRGKHSVNNAHLASTVKSEVESEVKPEVQHEVQHEVEPEVQPEAASEVEPEVESQVEPEVEP